MLTRVFVPLSQQSLKSLSAVARIEKRETRQQAALMLERALAEYWSKADISVKDDKAANTYQGEGGLVSTN